MRREAREKAFQLIFERLFVKESYGPDEEFFACLKKEEDKAFANEIVTKFSENKTELESLVEANLIGYALSRVYKVDLALIYLALTEIKFCGTPFQIAINETLEIAKRYSTEKSSRFINGVISAILKKD
ncbi:MAG: transcription antitermination factor NusB [Clostridia bacterium]|nr:transcription antitermination factor NusB [Clostridia bacterium]